MVVKNNTKNKEFARSASRKKFNTPPPHIKGTLQNKCQQSMIEEDTKRESIEIPKTVTADTISILAVRDTNEQPASLPENISRKLQCILREYLAEKDLQEAALSVEELKVTKHTHAAVITVIINYAIENTRTQAERRQIGTFCNRLLHEERIFTRTDFCEG